MATEPETPVSNITLIVIYSLTAVTIIFVAVISVTTVSNEGCSIDINEDFIDYHPLLLKQNSLEFILPNDGPEITFSSGDSFRLACTGQNNYLTINKLDLVTVTCLYDKTFSIDDHVYLFKELKCSNYSESMLRQTQNKCTDKNSFTEIGFNTSAGFVNLINTCFEDGKKDSLYSVHNLSASINYTQKTDVRLFVQSSFYGDLNLNDLYGSASQLKEFRKILDRSAADIITKQQYFNRGHLAPKGDFIYATQKRATYYYANVAPQWSDFNGGNWNQLEINARTFAINQNLNLVVYTGIFGNAQLQSKSGAYKGLSLYSDSNKANPKLTVPKIYWKILYEPVNKNATIFIGHNNPKEDNLKKICTDKCKQINWLTWEAENNTKGISYCCEYADVKDIINYFPKLEVKALLT